VKKSILLTFILWAAVGAAMYHSFHGRVEPPGDWVGALIGSFIAVLGIGALRNIGLYLRDGRLIRAAAKGAFLSDGSQVAAVGTMRVLREPLIAPFSKRPCALLAYEIYTLRTVRRQNSTNTEKSTLCSGMWMAPAAVRTTMGEVKIFGFPVRRRRGVRRGGRTSREDDVRRYFRLSGAKGLRRDLVGDERR
jgi:hypothetical protein